MHGIGLHFLGRSVEQVGEAMNQVGQHESSEDDGRICCHHEDENDSHQDLGARRNSMRFPALDPFLSIIVLDDPALLPGDFQFLLGRDLLLDRPHPDHDQPCHTDEGNQGAEIYD